MSCCGPATASENSSLRSTSRLLEGLHENIKLLVGNTRSSGTPALYAYSSCSTSIKRRNGIATSHRELFHNRGGRRLLISNHLEPTPWLDYKSAFALASLSPFAASCALADKKWPQK